ncbi:uncharacterized protein TM35_000016600 [Trypanosoma theileri]|uniref:Uncharacterized protein n=1 Tax=Trypanosoma theileri TaxID=67003 RepID=A0A1X0PAX3_9TRYP|nr:uncharacterized protein TM35_000016600 [Trypanosoma theileri]ORC93783.1 hypothetical protein TM35_000016600 [Trypanosoma theileri]
MQHRESSKRPSPFEEAAEQKSYRVADVQLAHCTQHNSAAVLCSTAGKIGRNGRSAAVGATLFWLTCPYLNTIVARFERHGAVSLLQKLLDENKVVAAKHVSSHTDYEKRAQALLSAERWAFFDSHFVSAGESTQGRKYGNAAVSHATDLKCLHALVAQSLCGASNIIGDAIIQYILLLSEKVKTFEKTLLTLDSQTNDDDHDGSDVADVDDDDNKDKDKDNSNGDDNKKINNSVALMNAKKSLDNVNALVSFVENSAVANEATDETSSPVLNADALCIAACNVLTFLEGRPPRLRKKHRLN